MNCREVVGESFVGRVFPQRGFKPVGSGAPFWRKASDGNSVTGDYNGLAVLDRVKQAGEIPRCVGCCYRDHEYVLSESLRVMQNLRVN